MSGCYTDICLSQSFEMSSIPQIFWFILISWEEIPSLFPRQKKNLLAHCLLVLFLIVFSQLLSSSLSLRSQRHLITWSFLPQLVAIATAPAVHTRISAQAREASEETTWQTDLRREPQILTCIIPEEQKNEFEALPQPGTPKRQNQAQCHTEVLNKSLLQLPDHPVVMENQVDLDLSC